MISNEDKIDIVINKLNNINALYNSFIENAEILENKYSLEDEIAKCNAKKVMLLEILDSLSGT